MNPHSTLVQRLTPRLINPTLAIVLMAFLLYPVAGKAAAAFFTVFIADPANAANMARVDGGSLRVRSVEEPARTPFQTYGEITIPDGSAGMAVNLPNPPVGKRLVIRFVSALVSVPYGQSPLGISVTTRVHQVGTPHYFTPSFVGDSGASNRFLVNSETMLFHDPQDGVVQILLDRRDLAGVAFARVSVSGYLVDCAIAACE